MKETTKYFLYTAKQYLLFGFWLWVVCFFFLFKYSVDQVKVTHQLLVHFCFYVSCKSEKCLQQVNQLSVNIF